jgi:hypothetical protein
MTIELPNYLAQIQRGELGLLEAAVPLLAGCAAFWLVRRLALPLRRLGRGAVVCGGLAGALAGLFLMNVTYSCPACRPATLGCRVVVRGVPFPQQTQERDSEPIHWQDGCRVASERSTPAGLANFSLGAFGVPGLLALCAWGYQRTRLPGKGSVDK